MQKTPDWIIANHNRKTHGRKFSALLCVSNRRVIIFGGDEDRRSGKMSLDLVLSKLSLPEI